MIDKVEEFADSEEEVAATSQIVEHINISTDELQPKQTEEQVNTSTDIVAPRQEKQQENPPKQKTLKTRDPMPVSSLTTEEIEILKQQLILANKEKVELFEVMKADLDWHKNQIQQLNDSLEKQRDQYEGLLRARDGELSKLEENLAEEQKWFDAEVISLTDKLNEVSFDMQQREQKIQSLESEVTLWKQRSDAAVQDEDLTRQMEQRIADYEIERKSLRKLSGLALKRIWTLGKSFIYRLRKR